MRQEAFLNAVIGGIEAIFEVLKILGGGFKTWV
jgi:hypothetical protein